MGDSAIDFVHVKQFAFAAQEVDTSYYNQIKGNDLKAYFNGQAVRQIDVAGSVETIYYPLEKDGSMVGLNFLQSAYLTMWLKENKIERLRVTNNPKGQLTPIPDLKPDQKELKDFFWYDYLRPRNKEDIYTVRKKKVQDAPKRSNKFVHGK